MSDLGTLIGPLIKTILIAAAVSTAAKYLLTLAKNVLENSQDGQVRTLARVAQVGGITVAALIVILITFDFVGNVTVSTTTKAENPVLVANSSNAVEEFFERTLGRASTLFGVVIRSMMPVANVFSIKGNFVTPLLGDPPAIDGEGSDLTGATSTPIMFTDTPTITMTVTSSPTSTIGYMPCKLVVTAVGGANLRSRPGTTDAHLLVGTVAQHTQWTADARANVVYGSPGGIWYHIVENGAWIWSRLVGAVGGCDSLPLYTEYLQTVEPSPTSTPTNTPEVVAQVISRTPPPLFATNTPRPEVTPIPSATSTLMPPAGPGNVIVGDQGGGNVEKGSQTPDAPVDEVKLTEPTATPTASATFVIITPETKTPVPDEATPTSGADVTPASATPTATPPDIQETPASATPTATQVENQVTPASATPSFTPSATLPPGGDPVVRIVRPPQGVTISEIGQTALQAVAHDPRIGDSDGAGVYYIQLKWKDAQGNYIFTTDWVTDYHAPYCFAEQSDGSCAPLTQAQFDQLIDGQTYQVWAMGRAQSGAEIRWQTHNVRVQRSQSPTLTPVPASPTSEPPTALPTETALPATPEPTATDVPLPTETPVPVVEEVAPVVTEPPAEEEPDDEANEATPEVEAE